MNILIEDAESLEFLTSNGNWTKKAADGISFGGTQAALAAAKKESVRKFNIVRYFPSTKQLVNMDSGTGKGK